jgi:hypothetical protein
MDDRISELPDEIVSYILTMLSIKDLMKASILSRRWCNVWSLRRDLHFDVLNVLRSEKEFSISMKQELNTFVALCATLFPKLEIMNLTTFSMVSHKVKRGKSFY